MNTVNTSLLLKNIKKHKWHYWFVSPMLVLFLLFTVWPILGSVYYSFFKWDGSGVPENYVGLDNFREILIDPYYWNAFVNNYIFAFSHVLIQFPLALILAIILNNTLLKGRNVYRLLIFLPVITTTAIIGLIFNILLHPAAGPLNEAMVKFSLLESPINFLGSVSLVLPTAIVISIWKNIGVTLIYWLAGLQTIPIELYEAARIDGASPVKTLFYITIPLLVPIGSVILLLTFISSLHPFDLIQTLSKGGPLFASDVVDTYVYRYAFNPELTTLRYGFASAGGFIFGVTVMLITIIQAPFIRKLGKYRT